MHVTILISKYCILWFIDIYLLSISAKIINLPDKWSKLELKMWLNSSNPIANITKTPLWYCVWIKWNHLPENSKFKAAVCRIIYWAMLPCALFIYQWSPHLRMTCGLLLPVTPPATLLLHPAHPGTANVAPAGRTAVVVPGMIVTDQVSSHIKKNWIPEGKLPYASLFP